MNEFLKNREQITAATKWLKDNGYVSHPISAKDWELMNVTKALRDGALIDLGADGSFVLHNAIKKGIVGRKVGIDLLPVTGDNKEEGAEYYVGDLMHTPFEDNSFDTVVSLSTIEHEVDLASFAKEASRLLKQRGSLIVSFDYWHPKVNTDDMKLYSLKWNILDLHDVIQLVNLCIYEGLVLSHEIDWTIQDKVINPSYCSPSKAEYTFGILEFIKK